MRLGQKKIYLYSGGKLLNMNVLYVGVKYVVDVGVAYVEKIEVGGNCLSPTTFTPSKDGWTFVGWREDRTASSEILTSKVKDESLLTLYAVFKKTITLSYNGNSSTGGSTTSHTGTQYYNNGNYTNPTFTLALNGFSRTGYTFQKWAQGSADGTQYAVGASVTLSADTTFYAVWKANTKYLFSSGAYQVSTSPQRLNYAYDDANTNTAAGYMKIVSNNVSSATAGQNITAYRITGLIDISDFSKITINYTVGTGYYVPYSTRMWISVHSGNPGNVYATSGKSLNSYSCVASNSQTGGTSLTLDISSLKGSYYLVVGCEYDFYAGVCVTGEATISSWYLI